MIYGSVVTIWTYSHHAHSCACTELLSAQGRNVPNVWSLVWLGQLLTWKTVAR